MISNASSELTMTTPSRLEKANAIRALSMDAVQQANSGHPGMPMGMADIAEVLWCDFLKHNPADPAWVDRDRFVLSNGHGSMLIYSLLHLTGYDLSIDEIKNFRQLHSKTPGHPEYRLTPGVETTTGPLGQGISNAVGMALSEKVLAAQFNRGEHNIVDHFTYVFMGDGCMMEGISHEACSLAGTLGLRKLIAYWDDNNISIDGDVDGWFTDDTPARFEAYGWHVVRGVDGHDAEAVRQATEQARNETERPTLICCKTIIGWGSPNKGGKASSHGAALGEDEVTLVREKIGWPHAPFEIPAEIYTAWDARSLGDDAQSAWNEQFASYRDEHPDLAAQFERRMTGKLPDEWQTTVEKHIQETDAAGDKLATRQASQKTLNAFGPVLPEIIGGSADLTGSNLTLWSDAKPITAGDAGGNYIYFGVREFGMSAITNGIALHGGFIPYAGTFLMFSEYARNALRMAALMQVPSIFVYTHDSVGLGEDGPTHQAVEQTATLRCIPNMSVWRPCDTVETAVAWQAAIESTNTPTCLLLSRQGLPCQQRDADQMQNIRRGAYVLSDCAGEPQAIIIATGSEVELAMNAANKLHDAGTNVRVVSMPSTDAFDAQDDAYKQSVLPDDIRQRLVIEAGVSNGWYKYASSEGRIISIDTFGESAPAGDVFKHFGFTVENVVNAVNDLVS